MDNMKQRAFKVQPNHCPNYLTPNAAINPLNE